MIVKLPTEHHLEFLSLKGGCRGSSESTLVKISHCWKFHALTQMVSVLSVRRQQPTLVYQALLKSLYLSVVFCSLYNMSAQPIPL